MLRAGSKWSGLNCSWFAVFGICYTWYGLGWSGLLWHHVGWSGLVCCDLPWFHVSWRRSSLAMAGLALRCVVSSGLWLPALVCCIMVWAGEGRDCYNRFWSGLVRRGLVW